MKRIAYAAMLSLVATGVFAADLPPAAPPPQAPAVYVPAALPAYNWGGIYVGINGGWGFGKATWTSRLGSGSDSDNGGVVGGTLGFNYQMNAFVFGVEGDFDYSGINTGTSNSVCNISGTCQTGNTWLSTVRGRAGYAFDRVLLYLTAGGVFGSVQTTFNGVTTTRTQEGWTAGLGVEYAFAQNWTAKLEYLYADLGSTSVNCSSAGCLAVPPAGTPINASVSLTDSLVRVGVNYKFNF
ncbi:MAG: outer membrane protein [Xanthobacteraceae bacterium]|jgi:outer membrane immunogenic protein